MDSTRAQELDVQRAPAQPPNGHTPRPAPANGDSGGSELPRQVVVVKVPAAEVARVGLVLIGLGLGLYLLWTIHEVVFVLFLAIMLATAIEPIVNRLRRGPFSRGSGVLVVYTAIVLAIGLPTVILAPSLAAQADAFAAGIPDRIGALRPYAEQLRPAALRDVAVNAIGRVTETVRNPAPPREEELVGIGATVAHYALNFFSVFFLAFYWLVERASIKRALLRLVPNRRAKDVNAVWLEVEEKLGGWVRGQLLVMLAMGVMATVGFFFIGLPNPILLGVLAGLAEIVPMVGPFLAFAPAVIVALTIDPYVVLLVIGFGFVIQQIESNVLVPRIMGHTVGVSPLTVLLGILIGAILYGVPGAFLAVPVAGAIQVILAHALGLEDPVQAEEHDPPVVRDDAREATAEPEPSPAAGRVKAAIQAQGER